MISIPRFSWSSILVALALAAVLAACSSDARKGRHLERAERYFDQEKYAEAAIEYMNVLRLDNSNRVAIVRIGLARFAQGDLQEAFPFLSKAAQLDPDNNDVRIKLATVYLLSGNADEARDEAEKVLAKEPANFEALMVWSSASMSRDLLDENLARLKSAEAQCGNQPRFHIALGAIQVRKGNLAAAGAEFEKAVEVDPKSADAQIALADYLMAKGETKAAGEHYQAAVDLSPIDSSARVKWSGYKLQTGDAKEARRILEEITEKAPGYLPAWFGLAEFNFADKDYDACLRNLGKVLQKEPHHVQALLLRGKTRVAKGDIDKAMEEYEKLIASFPRFAPLHYNLAIALVRKASVPRAIDELKQAVDLDPDYTDAGFLLSELLIRTGKPDGAIDYLQQLVKAHPELPRAYVMLGTAYRARGMSDRAVAAYNKLIELQPTSPQGPYMLGLVLRAQGKKDEARAFFEKALSLAPDFAFAVASLASLDVADRNYDAALDRVKRQLESQPSVPEYHYILGKVYVLKGDTELAEQSLLKAIELQPRLSAAYVDLGRIYARSGKRDEAISKLEEALTVNPRNIAALMMAGMFLQEKGDYAKAKEHYENILKVNSKFAPAANNLAYLYSDQFGDNERAFELAKQARESAPQDAYVADTLGWIAYQRGDYKWASILLQESADDLPNEPEVQYHCAMARYALGDEASALRLLENALKEPDDFKGREEASNLLAVLSIDPATADASASAMLEEALRRDAKNLAALVRLGLVNERAGKANEARDLYEEALKANPSYVPALVYLAEVHAASLGDKAKALELARKARELMPTDPQIVNTLGWVAYLSGDFAWAAGLLGETAAKLSSDPTAQYRAGLAAYALGKVDDAEAAMRHALSLSSDFQAADEARLFIEMAEAARSVVTDPQALARADEVLKTRPDYVPALAVQAAALGAARDTAGARAACEKILATYPDHAPAVLRLASLYADGRVSDDAALKIAQRAREMKADDPAIAAALGTISYLRGQYERAAQLLQESAGKDANNATTQFYLGMSKLKMKTPSAAKAALTRALEINPSFPYASEASKALSELN
ncbi:MAG: tetratricopeptide repeat protein [bacterium]